MSDERANGIAVMRGSIVAPCYDPILRAVKLGELPFRGNKRMLLMQIIHDEPPSPRKLDASVPRDLETICLKCLEKSPERRYATARGMADELRRYLAGAPILARPVGRVERSLRWCRRNPVVASLAATAILARGIANRSKSPRNKRCATFWPRSGALGTGGHAQGRRRFFGAGVQSQRRLAGGCRRRDVAPLAV